jgi:hypothetical protein
MCSIYIYDLLQVPIRNDELLYDYIKQKRLSRILPEITSMFIRLFKNMSDIDYSIAKFMCIVEDTSLDDDDIIILKWRALARWFSLVDSDFGLIEILLQEHGVCSHTYMNDLIGYFLERLFLTQQVHKEHSNPSQGASIEVEADVEAVDQAIRIVEGYDELYD